MDNSELQRIQTLTASLRRAIAPMAHQHSLRGLVEELKQVLKDSDLYIAETAGNEDSNPLEASVAEALRAAGIGFTRPDQNKGDISSMDFRLDSGLQIEVKGAYSKRVWDQVQRAGGEGIVLLGEDAVRFFVDQLCKPQASSPLTGA